MIASFHESSATDDAYTLAMRIAIESGLRDYIFSGHDPEDISRQENLQEMLDGIAAFVQDNQEQGRGMLLADYLQEASLATDLDRRGQGEDDDSVNMMTIHTAKGLEFPVVFIAGMEEGLFPSEMTADSPRQLEEERRLFYVALTRAERQVVLTCARSRFRNGKMEYARPSRFLREIPQEFFRRSPQNPSPDLHRSPSPDLPQRGGHTAAAPSPNTRIKHSLSGNASSPLGEVGRGALGEVGRGATVLHERFGRGVVQDIEGSGIDAKAKVLFENAGTKVLMLRFAKLTIV